MRGLLSLIVVIVLALPLPAHAVQPDEVLDDPALEDRARHISADLRCMVCQNQSIDDSDAPLARDLRLLVRERLVAGDSDTEVVDYVVDRYGEYVLLNPRFAAHTLILWLGAPLLFLMAGTAIAVTVARRRTVAPQTGALTAAEEARIAKLLSEDDAR